MPELRLQCVLKGYVHAQLYVCGPKICIAVELTLYKVPIFYLQIIEKIIISREINYSFVSILYSGTKIYVVIAVFLCSRKIAYGYVYICISRSEDHFRLSEIPKNS
ncbi:MAG: hypothetical protein K0R54_3245 [Clostridiaceae bacterium]|jgi:hypothetical protein|nr:hypothetical protein [Clostridiaceae bacterium]